MHDFLKLPHNCDSYMGVQKDRKSTFLTVFLLSCEQRPSSDPYRSVQPTNTLWAGRHQVVKGVWWPEGFAMINNVVCCVILFPAYARGCLSQPSLTHVKAETSDSSSEPV